MHSRHLVRARAALAVASLASAPAVAAPLTLSREALFDAVGDASYRASSPRIVDVHIRRIRAKLGAREDLIHTVRGVGYKLAV